MSRYVVILVLFAFIAWANPAPAQSKVLTEATPAAGGFSAARLARLDSGMNDWVKNKWVNGSVALIARKGKIVFYKAYGYNDPDTKVLLDKNGIFRIASQTKAITTVAVMMLWEEGKFSLDDSVASSFRPSPMKKYWPPSTLTTPHTQPFRLSGLLRSVICSRIRPASVTRELASRQKMLFMQKVILPGELAQKTRNFLMQ